MREMAWVGHGIEHKAERLGRRVKSGFKHYHRDRKWGLIIVKLLAWHFVFDDSALSSESQLICPSFDMYQLKLQLH